MIRLVARSVWYYPCFTPLPDVTRYPVLREEGKTACETWNAYPTITATFTILMGELQLSDVDHAMNILERFVILLYDKTSARQLVNEARVDLFARKGLEVSNIPPT